MTTERAGTGGECRWEGPASAVVRGALVFPGHASLWTAGTAWGGRLLLDVFAPFDESHDIELALRHAGRHRVAVEAVTRQPGIQTPMATAIVFTGDGPVPSGIFS